MHCVIIDSKYGWLPTRCSAITGTDDHLLVIEPYGIMKQFSLEIEL